MESKNIIIDFDGTCVTHDFPNVGKDIGAARIIKKLVRTGHNIILSTMRCDHDFEPSSDQPDVIAKKGNYLSDAINWFKENDIPLYGVQKHPTQHHWTSSPKCYGDILIDDTALGCPLSFDEELSDRPFVNWTGVYNLCLHYGLLKREI